MKNNKDKVQCRECGKVFDTIEEHIEDIKKNHNPPAKFNEWFVLPPYLKHGDMR